MVEIQLFKELPNNWTDPYAHPMFIDLAEKSMLNSKSYKQFHQRQHINVDTNASKNILKQGLKELKIEMLNSFKDYKKG